MAWRSDGRSRGWRKWIVFVPVGMPWDGRPWASRAISRTFPALHCCACFPFTKCRYSSSLPVSVFSTALRTWSLSRHLAGRRCRTPRLFGKGRCWTLLNLDLMTLVVAALGDGFGVCARGCDVLDSCSVWPRVFASWATVAWFCGNGRFCGRTLLVGC